MKKEKKLGLNEDMQEAEGLTVIDTGDGSEVFDDIALDTFSSDALSEREKPKKRKTGLKKRLLIMLIAVAVLASAFGVVYLTVIKPIYDEKKALESAKAEPEPMIEGEVRADNGVSILMYKHIDEANTKRVTVVNPDPLVGGEFNLVRNKDGDFYVKEHGEMAPVTTQTALNVIVAAGYSVISSRIEENCTDMKKYGLTEEDYPRKVTIEALDGQTYTFYIGARITSEGGFYCRAEGRNAVYIIEDSAINALMGTSESLIQPILGPVFDANSALMMDQFVLSKNGQRFVSISFTELDTESFRQSSYKMNFPASYVVNDDKFSSGVLGVIASLEGYTVVAAGDGTSDGMLYKNPTLMAQFGFYDTNNPPFEIYYEFGDIAGYVMFTESGSDAYYYAYSLVYDTIVLVEKSKVPFLEWDLLEYVNDRIFFEYIKDVSSLAVSGNIDYQQSTHKVDEKFTYWHDDEDQLNCRAESTGLGFVGNYEDRNYILAFYQVALTLNIDGYISEKETNFNMEDAEEYARFTIEYIDGETRTYVFYKFSGYCYFTVNGAGDFYVSTAAVNKLLVNALRAANNCEVKKDMEYPLLPDNYLERIDGK